MPATPKVNIKYVIKPDTKPVIAKGVILDAGFRQRVDPATEEVTGNYISLAIITSTGDSHTARLQLNGGAKAITKRTLEQLGCPLAELAKDEKGVARTPTQIAEALAEALNGTEVVVSVTQQIAIDDRTGAPAVDDKGVPIKASENCNIRTNDLEAGAAFVADLFAE